MRNLIENAGRYGMIDAATSPARIQVRVRADQVVVEDEEPGYPPGLLGSVPEPFLANVDIGPGRHAPGPGRNGPGTGLGLAIARPIGELHGGGLRLQNREGGRGARATLWLGRVS